MRKPLTPRQQEIYDFIVGEVRRRGMPPTIREIGDRFGMRSSNGAREALNALARKGYIRRHDRLSRGIELVEPIEASDRVSTSVGRQVPLIEHLSAAMPQISEATIARYMVLDSSLLPQDGTPFALVVPDNALEASGLMAGDYAIATTTAPRLEGDIAVVLVGSRLLVRRYHLASSIASLETDRDEDKALVLGGTRPEIHLLGTVRCIVRTVLGRVGE